MVSFGLLILFFFIIFFDFGYEWWFFLEVCCLHLCCVDFPSLDCCLVGVLLFRVDSFLGRPSSLHSTVFGNWPAISYVVYLLVAAIRLFFATARSSATCPPFTCPLVVSHDPPFCCPDLLAFARHNVA